MVEVCNVVVEMNACDVVEESRCCDVAMPIFQHLHRIIPTHELLIYPILALRWRTYDQIKSIVEDSVCNISSDIGLYFLIRLLRSRFSPLAIGKY